MKIRLPAEWEPQSGILLAWPHAATDWADLLVDAESVYIHVIEVITRFQLCVIACPEPDSVRERLETAGIPLERVRLYPVVTNDTWARDFGPITVYEGSRPLLLDFGFNGWGLKFASYLDNQATRLLHAAGAFGSVDRRTIGLILEGGSIESDGEGTVLTTSECLLNPNRNPHLNRAGIEQQLQALLGAEQILWLENGCLAGDDTDSHIDTLARLCPDHTILYQACTDAADEHFPALAAMEEELQRFRTCDGAPYRLLPLPWPHACHADGHRLPATYANFLVINGAVLVPTYNDPHDQDAVNIIARAFPGREVVGIDCSTLIRQHGSLHCITMQIPQGVPL